MSTRSVVLEALRDVKDPELGLSIVELGLVKKVEIDEQEVRIVYRVSPSPFEGGPQQGSLQHCWGRDDPALANWTLDGMALP